MYLKEYIPNISLKCFLDLFLSQDCLCLSTCGLNNCLHYYQSYPQHLRLCLHSSYDDEKFFFNLFSFSSLLPSKQYTAMSSIQTFIIFYKNMSCILALFFASIYRRHFVYLFIHILYTIYRNLKAFNSFIDRYPMKVGTVPLI